MNSNQIEKKGISALNNLILFSNLLRPEIREGDTYPLWDGEIIVYNDPKQANHNIQGRVPVQVKSTLGRASYSVSRSDLEVYLRDGGLLFFLVDINPQPRVYVSILLPMDIREHLEANQKSYTLDLQLISDVSKLERICFFFLNNKKLQSGAEQSVSIHSLAKDGRSLMLSILPENNFIETIEKGRFYAYSMAENSPAIPCKLDFEAFALTGPAKVSINGMEYFNSSTVFRGPDKKPRVFLNSAVEFLEDKDGHASFSLILQPEEDREILLADVFSGFRFFAALQKSKTFEINGKEVSSDFSDNAVSYTKNREWGKLLQQLLDSLRIDYSKITLSRFRADDAEYQLIKFLAGTLIEKQRPELRIKADLFIKRFRIFSQDVLIIYERGKDGKYTLFDFNSKFPQEETIRISGKDKAGAQISYNASKYLLLNNTDLIRGISGFTDRALEGLTNGFDRGLQQFYIQFILLCLHVYDQDADLRFLNLSEKLCEVLIPKNLEITDALRINRLQIARRSRPLNTREIENLIDMRNQQNTDKQILCCCHILMDKFEDFETIFPQLEENQQIEFKSWPIYTLYARWKQKI